MKNTRFMSRMFSAVNEGDEELTQQVANDIESAKRNGSVDTDELTYVDLGCGKVEITDNENGEQTIAEKAEDGNYDLYPAEMSEQIEGYLHPEGDGVTPGQQKGEDDEDVYANHDVNTNPSRRVIDLDECCAEDDDEPCECEDDDEEEKEFSVSTDNTVVLRIFSDQVFCERVFSEVIESEETAKVGNLKIEKLEDEDNAVVVTDTESGDQAKIVLDDDEMDVTELDSKNFSDDEEDAEEDEYDDEEGDEDDDYEDGFIDRDDESGYGPLHVVGLDTFNHQLIDATEYDEESAQDLVERLQEVGIDGVRIFDNSDDARDYAFELLNGLDAEDYDEPKQAEFSEHDIFLTQYYNHSTNFMTRLFSEACNEIDATQSTIEEVLENGDEKETDTEIITPVDDNTVIVEDKDNGELTKVVLDHDELECSPISEEEANRLKEDYDDDDDDEDDDNEEEEKTYSNVEETKFFSEYEIMTDYMCRLFSDEASEEDIEKAIENDKQIETDSEIITPVDDKTAVVEDKETGEYTKAVMTDDDIDLTPISAKEAADLTEEDDDDDNEEEKTYSNEDETKFFSGDEIMTEYMCRLFNEEADGNEDDIEQAIEDGKKVETDKEIITPIDDETAIIEDKESGEYTKATLSNDNIHVTHIDEKEAEDMLEDAKNDEDDDDEERSYSDYYMNRFFADVPTPGQPGTPAAPGQAPAEPEIIQATYDENGNLVPLDEANGKGSNEQGQAGSASPEAIEDAALAAVQQIQNAANEAQNAIMTAKNAPAESDQAELQEAQFSERCFSDGEDDYNDTLISWLNNK